LKSPVKEQERNLTGICQDRAAGIYGIVCKKSTSTGNVSSCYEQTLLIDRLPWLVLVNVIFFGD